jgi:hypothetical protein
MALHQGWGVNSVDIDAPDVRLANAGLLTRDTGHKVRSGIISNRVRTIVTGRADMKVDVAFFTAAAARTAADGTVLYGNDGTAQVSIDTAPTANSRIDIVYVLVQDTTKGNPAGPPIFGVAKGDANAQPVAPTIPAGADELARLEVSTGATSTSSGVVITQTHRYTNVHGGRVPFRTLTTLRGETSLPEGTLALVDDGLARTYRYDGTTWRLWEQPPTAMTLTASGDLNLGSSGGATFIVSVSSGRATVDFRLRAAGNNIAWGSIRYALPHTAFDTFGTSPNAGAGTAVLNDANGGKYGAWVDLAGDGTWSVNRTGADYGALASWSSSQPFAFGANDTVMGSFSYLAA